MDDNAKRALILEQILQAAVDGARDSVKENGNFADGKRFAYYDILSVAAEQAGLLGIQTSKIGMTDFDPDRELLTATYKKAA